jgi:hypothetical protein
MPFRDGAHLNPILTRLSGSAEADALDLILVTGRTEAAALSETLDEQFHFYGLRGALVMVPDHQTLPDQLDAGASATDATDLLVWQTSVLPKATGWLDALKRCRDSVNGPAVVAPMLCYEDGSVYFGGSTDVSTPPGAICAMVGFDRRGIRASASRQATAVPAEFALIDHALLRECGGFRCNLWGDRLMGQDLSHRLKGVGAEIWCVADWECWMLDAIAPEAVSAQPRLIDRVDAGLLALQHTMFSNGPTTQPDHCDHILGEAVA